MELESAVHGFPAAWEATAMAVVARHRAAPFRAYLAIQELARCTASVLRAWRDTAALDPLAGLPVRAEALVADAEGRLLDHLRAHREDRALHARVREYYLDPQRREYAKLVRMGDPESFERLLAMSREDLSSEYWASRPAIHHALAAFAAQEELRPRVLAHFRSAFDVLREAARENDVLFPAVAYCLADLGGDGVPLLLEREFEFCCGEDKGYSLHEAAGDLAVALSLAGGESTAALDRFLADPEAPPSDSLRIRVRYARWMIARDPGAAATHLEDPRNRRGLAYAACALADLDAKDVAPLLRRRLVELENPATREAFLEALDRLARQAGRPLPKERMVHLFGRVTPSERSQGVEGDDVFALRAAARSGGAVAPQVEADDAMDEDY